MNIINVNTYLLGKHLTNATINIAMTITCVFISFVFIFSGWFVLLLVHTKLLDKETGIKREKAEWKTGVLKERLNVYPVKCR